MARKANLVAKVGKLAERYLFENVGEMAVANMPRYDAERRRWVVAILCETPRADMVHAVEEQLRRLPHLVFAEANALQAKGFDAITIH